MTTAAASAEAVLAARKHSVRRDPPLVQWGLTLAALGALGLFILLPLIVVFVEAFQ